MSGTPRVQRIAECLIRASCRRLTGELRAERCREWSAEVPAILHDETIRSGLIRAMRALSYSVGVFTATRRLSRGAGRSRRARLTVAAATATLLASIALYPLMSGGMWFWAGMGAVIVVGAIGAVTRRRAIPAILCFAAMIAGEFVYLNILFARHWSLGGLVPTGASVHHLRLLVAQATAETSKYAPPIPPRPGIVLVTAAGIGLVAALTDVLAVRLHRPAIAGLPLLVLFCVPLTTDARPGAVGGALVFCAGVVGYLGLLSAELTRPARRPTRHNG